MLVTLFALVSLISGIRAWVDYKREESTLLGSNYFPARLNSSSLFRWYETYMILFVILSAGLILSGSLIFLIPAVQ
jgi:hypothetical protein